MMMFSSICMLSTIVAVSFHIGSVTCQVNSTEGNWIQIGKDIIGEFRIDNSGTGLAMSADGSVVAIGAPYNDGDLGFGTDAGHARVYKVNPTRRQWKQLGEDINGEVVDGNFGHTLAMSANGMMMIVGAPSHSRQVPFRQYIGRIRVLQFNTTSAGWNQVGSSIDGESVGDFFGESVAMSDNGMIIAVGAVGNGIGGHVRMFQLNRSTQRWRKLGSDIQGTQDGGAFGRSIAMSADGTIVVVGDPTRGSTTGSSEVRVHKYSSSLKQWQQMGPTLLGEFSVDALFGEAVAMSADGSTIAITSSDGNGINVGYTIAVQVFTYSTTSATWEQVGSTITESDGFAYITAVAMAADGKTIAFGNKIADYGQVDNLGHVRVFTNYGNDWEQVGSNVTGKEYGDNAGESVAISADGRTLAVGSPYYRNFVEDPTTRLGAVRIYEFQPTIVVSPKCMITWNLYNSVTDQLVAQLTNGTAIRDPGPCNRTNIEAVVPCDDKGIPSSNTTTVVIELFNDTGRKLIHRMTQRKFKYFLYGDNGTNVFDGRIPAGTYMIRAIVNQVSISPFTKFTLGGTCM